MSIPPSGWHRTPPPLEFFDEAGNYRGLVADHMRLIEQRLGVRFEVLRYANWAEVIEALKTGIGIKKEHMDKLFQPFPQIDVSFTKGHEGTGLGLHLSKKLVNLLGSDITVRSGVGKGSIFKFDILVDLADRVEIETEKPSPRVYSGLRRVRSSFRHLWRISTRIQRNARAYPRSCLRRDVS
jgi:hypothetical protein